MRELFLAEVQPMRPLLIVRGLESAGLCVLTAAHVAAARPHRNATSAPGRQAVIVAEASIDASRDTLWIADWGFAAVSDDERHHVPGAGRNTKITRAINPR